MKITELGTLLCVTIQRNTMQRVKMQEICHFCLKQRLESIYLKLRLHLNDKAIRFRNISSNCIIELCDGRKRRQ